MAKGKSSGIATAIGLIILFALFAALTPAFLIAGMMGASDNPNAHYSSSTQMLMVFGPITAMWTLFIIIAAFALRKKPEAKEETNKPESNHIINRIGSVFLNGLGATLFTIFLYFMYKAFW